jgi:hypothetical protein
LFFAARESGCTQQADLRELPGFEIGAIKSLNLTRTSKTFKMQPESDEAFSSIISSTK